MRQPILYAELMWRSQRVWVLLLVAAGVLVSPAEVILNHGHFDANTAVFLGYLPLGLLYGAGLLYYRQRSAAEITEGGLRITKLFRRGLVPYDLIRGTRVQTLEPHFQDSRKRLIRPMARDLLKKNALFVRLRADDPRVAQLRSVLGREYVSDDTLAVPIPDPDAMAWEVTSRLPERTGVNLGGQRRRKRARAR